jgi:hypothetical protein
VSELIAIPTGQFNQCFDELVDHPGGAGMVIGKQEKKLKVQTGRRHLPRLMDHRDEGCRGQPAVGQLLATHGEMCFLWNGGLQTPTSSLHCAGQKM